MLEEERVDDGERDRAGQRSDEGRRCSEPRHEMTEPRRAERQRVVVASERHEGEASLIGRHGHEPKIGDEFVLVRAVVGVTPHDEISGRIEVELRFSPR